MTQSDFEQRHPALYFAYAGWVVALLVVTTWIERLRLGEYGWMFTKQLVAIGCVTGVFAALAVVRKRPTRMRRFFDREFSVPALFATAVFVIAALVLSWLDHRRFVFVVGALEGAAVCALLGARLDWAGRLWTFVLAIATWSFASGLTYVHLDDWLLNAAPSSALAVAAFTFAFAIVLSELSDDGPADSSRRENVWLCAVALGAFALSAFRTDNLSSDWVPIHRSYFADIAQFVKDGHWLLWDVPSLYGFLSILSLALLPTSDGWQALYVLTGLFLTVQSAITAVILRWGRSGWRNAAIAVLFPLATILAVNLSRYAWGARLYPQGGMRFIWIDVLLFVAFFSYVWREHTRRVLALRWLGHAAWLVAVFWSIENGLWATAVWLSFLIFDAIASPNAVANARQYFVRLAARAWPLVISPFVAIRFIAWWYATHLGSGPDWRAYVEFTGFFTSGTARTIFHVQNFGAGWCIVIVLCAAGSLGVLALIERRWQLAPLLAAAFAATWVTASYYAIEPLDMYVTLLLAVLAPVAAIIIFSSREFEARNINALLARLSLAPLMIITIAFALGEPERMASMQLPFTSGWSPHVLAAMPPIRGELHELIVRAGINPGDRVLVPNGAYWTELDQGLILPLAHDPVNGTVQYTSWLPISPVAPRLLANALPKERLRVYVDRFLDRSREAGWYIAYRERARCERLSSRLLTLKTETSRNFSVSLCKLRR